MKSLKYLCCALIALSAPLFMAIYHTNGMVCIYVVRYEAIAAILATCSAIIAFSEYERGAKTSWALAICSDTPLYNPTHPGCHGGHDWIRCSHSRRRNRICDGGRLCFL